MVILLILFKSYENSTQNFLTWGEPCLIDKERYDRPLAG